MAILRVAIPGALCGSSYFIGVVFLQSVKINFYIVQVKFHAESLLALIPYLPETPLRMGSCHADKLCMPPYFYGRKVLRSFFRICEWLL